MSVRIEIPSSPKEAPPPPATAPVNDTMRRLQIGIAGVLTVLLLVGMAGLIGDRARQSAGGDMTAAAEVKMHRTLLLCLAAAVCSTIALCAVLLLILAR